MRLRAGSRACPFLVLPTEFEGALPIQAFRNTLDMVSNMRYEDVAPGS